MDPLLPFQEGILPHQYICQVNKDSPLDVACQEREFRKDNRPLLPLLVRPSEEVKMVQSPPEEYPWVEQGHSD